MKRNQQQLLDRDGTDKLIDRIQAAETLLSAELRRIKGKIECDAVEPQLINQIEVKMVETDEMIQDDLDMIKDKVEEDFSALNALQEMLHLLLMRQVIVLLFTLNTISLPPLTCILGP